MAGELGMEIIEEGLFIELMISIPDLLPLAGIPVPQNPNHRFLIRPPP